VKSGIFTQFNASGIGFPFPARDVCVHQISGAGAFRERGDSKTLEQLTEIPRDTHRRPVIA
jgi:hypothetical protein